MYQRAIRKMKFSLLRSTSCCHVWGNNCVCVQATHLRPFYILSHHLGQQETVSEGHQDREILSLIA